MEDFEKILNDWESQKNQNQNKKKKKKTTTTPAQAVNPMELWLDKYDVEDKDQNAGNKRVADLSRKTLHTMAPQDRIDLHGYIIEDAIVELERFLKNAQKRKLRKVLVIHGKGHHSPGRKSILRKEVRLFLERSSRVGEFGPANRTDGGDGASWAIIKSP